MTIISILSILTESRDAFFASRSHHSVSGSRYQRSTGPLLRSGKHSVDDTALKVDRPQQKFMIILTNVRHYRIPWMLMSW